MREWQEVIIKSESEFWLLLGASKSNAHPARVNKND